MAIVVACRCGQAFEADLYLAGKVVQCPACRSPIAVPTPVPEAPRTYVPRPRTAVSRGTKEAAESITTFLVAGGVLFVVVLGLSISIICYLKGTNPIAWIEALREQGKREREARWAARAALVGEARPQAAPDGPVPVAVPAAQPAAPLPAPSGLPEGWSFHEHAAGRFSAAFPAPPEIIERKLENVGGDQTFFVLAVSQDEHVFEATREFSTYKIRPGTEAAAYDAHIRRRAAEWEDGIVEGSKHATVDGRLVCDAIIRGKEGEAEFRKYIRLIASGDSVFELSCRVPPGKERPAEISAFLGNYKLQE